MESLFSNILTASFHGSIVILAVMLLRVPLKKAPRKFICFLWLLAGLRLLMPFEIQSSLSLQPMPEVAQVQQWQPSATPDPAPRETFPEPPAHRQEAQLPQTSENPTTIRCPSIGMRKQGFGKWSCSGGRMTTAIRQST